LRKTKKKGLLPPGCADLLRPQSPFSDFRYRQKNKQMAIALYGLLIEIPE
jgi:hypothetical protein